MGRPKATLPVAGITLIDWLLRRLAPHFAAVMISAASDTELPRGLPGRILRDRHANAGPLAGIEAGLAAAEHAVLFVIACDMPYVTGELARELVAASSGHDAAVPRLEGRPQPACAAYRDTALPAVTAALRERRLRVADVLDRLDVAWLERIDARQLRNLNTQDEYQAFIDEAR